MRWSGKESDFRLAFGGLLRFVARALYFFAWTAVAVALVLSVEAIMQGEPGSLWSVVKASVVAIGLVIQYDLLRSADIL